ncbi:MAG: ribonuclease R, partial [Acetatifactor sp.]|nr:ribonuclease R [Acetatifactor sp.]
MNNIEEMKKTESDHRKEVICELVADRQYVPMKEKELAMLLQVPREERRILRQLLEELLAEGRLTVNAHGKYKKPDGRILTGTFIT